MKKIVSKSELENLADMMYQCITWYQRGHFEESIYNLSVDNGDKLNIVFARKTVAHLLGVDTECLKAKGIFNTDSFSILKEICNNSYRVYKEVYRGELQYSDFISDFAFDKVENFKNVCGINFKNIEFICQYKSENSYITGSKKLDADYYIAYNVPGGLSIIGFKKDGKFYYPMTNRYIDFSDEKSMEFLNDLLANQTITMPTSINIYNKNLESSGRSFRLFYEDKLDKLKRLQFYSNKYGAIIDVSNGYEYVIQRLMRLFDTNSSMMPIFERIFDYISNRILINIDALEREFGKLPDAIISLIDIYNNSLEKDIKDALDEYVKKLTNKYRTQKDQIEALQEEKERLLGQIEKLQEENRILSKENEDFKERKEAMIRILMPKGSSK